MPAAIINSSELLQAEMPSHCRELVKNGDFEEPNFEWSLLGSERPPQYQGDITHLRSKYALHLGNTDTSTNVPSSSVTEQTIFLPDDAIYIILDFHYYPIFYAPKPDDGDDQFLEITNALTDQLIDRPFSILKNDRRWLFKQHDLTLLKGQQIRLRFGVNNDGANGQAAMYLDNVSIRACYKDALDPTTSPTLTSEPSPSLVPVALIPAIPTPTPTTSMTPTPTKEVILLSSRLTPYPPIAPTKHQYPTSRPLPATTAPSGCNAPLWNPSFEESDAYWDVGNDPIPPQPVSEERYSGTYSMLLGSPPHVSHVDLQSFSSIRQLVALPTNASTINLRWQALYRSEESYDSNPSARYDHQELVLLDTNLSTIAVPHRIRRNDGLWTSESVDLTPYRGRTLYVYFNVYNDGNGRRTWMYLDYVDLQVCYAAYVDPYPTALPMPFTPAPPPTYPPTYTPTATAIATPTTAQVATATVTPAATPTPTTIPATSTTTATAPPTATAAAISTATGTATTAPTVYEILTTRRPPLPHSPTSPPTQLPTSTFLPTDTPVESTPTLLFVSTAASPTSVWVPITTETLVVNPTFTTEPLLPLSTRIARPTPTSFSIFGFTWGDMLSENWVNRIGTFAVLVSILAIIGLICWFLRNRFFKP